MRPDTGFLPCRQDIFVMSPELRNAPMACSGIAIQLMCFQWLLGLLPPEADRLRALVGASLKEWEVFDPLLDKLFPINETGSGRQMAALEEDGTVLEKCWGRPIY